MGKQLVFIDDSGDPGFVSKASSSRLMMAGALFIDPETATRLNRAISQYRRSLGWRENHEFKFNKATKEVKLGFLRLTREYDFEIYAVYIDKSLYPRAIQISDHEKLYNWTTKELLKIMPLSEAYVKIDGRSSREYKMRVAAYIRREVNADTYKIKEIRTQDSTKDNLIQLADMVVGAINRSFQAEKTDAKDYIRIIRKKIVKLQKLSLE